MSALEVPIVSVLNPGECASSTLILDAPLNFWGGFNPSSGRITDERHPQYGESLAGQVLVMPPSRGSGTNAQIFAQACANRQGPAGVLLTGKDFVVTVGAIVAKRLYNVACPVVVVDWDLSRISSRDCVIRIDASPDRDRARVLVASSADPASPPRVAHAKNG